MSAPRPTIPYLPSRFLSNGSIQKTGPNKYTEFLESEVIGIPSNTEAFEAEFSKKMDAFYQSQQPEATTTQHNTTQLSELLDSNFVVGEAHDDILPKDFLINNMAALKKAGFTTLFLEHLYYDDQQELDQFSPENKNPSANDIETKKHIDSIFYPEPINPYKYFDLVRAAKKTWYTCCRH